MTGFTSCLPVLGTLDLAWIMLLHPVYIVLAKHDDNGVLVVIR